MKNSKKRLVSMISLAAAFVLGACGNNSNEVVKVGVVGENNEP